VIKTIVTKNYKTQQTREHKYWSDDNNFYLKLQNATNKGTQILEWLQQLLLKTTKRNKQGNTNTGVITTIVTSNYKTQQTREQKYWSDYNCYLKLQNATNKGTEILEWWQQLLLKTTKRNKQGNRNTALV
jgi:hypothetical protein